MTSCLVLGTSIIDVGHLALKNKSLCRMKLRWWPYLATAAHKCEPTVILSEEAVSHHNLNGHPNPASNRKTDFESSQQQQPMTNGLREDPLEGPQPAGGVVDLSVKGVLISEFSSSEQLRYLERRRSRSVSPFAAGQIQPDFCINIWDGELQDLQHQNNQKERRGLKGKHVDTCVGWSVGNF